MCMTNVHMTILTLLPTQLVLLTGGLLITYLKEYCIHNGFYYVWM